MENASVPSTAEVASAILQRDEKLLEQLLAAGANPDGYFGTRSLLELAFDSQLSRLSCLLIEHGADPNQKLGDAPFVHWALARYDEDLLRLLVAKKANFNAPNPGRSGGNTLSHAVIGAPRKVLQLLLSAGADPNQPDDDGRTPLHHAVCMDNAQAVEMLLGSGADAARMDRHGCRPYDYACSIFGEHDGGRGRRVKELLLPFHEKALLDAATPTAPLRSVRM